MRHALYFTPPADHPLVLAAERWLGRSVFPRDVPAETIGGVTPDERETLTADPRRYGFHGTLKAPFRLVPQAMPADLHAALEAFGAERAAAPAVRLRVSSLGGFLALTPAAPAPGLDALAGDVVRRFEPFRAALSDGEIARRNPESLTDAQRENLEKWGYPYVFAAFRFHMTLTGRLNDAEAARLLPILEAHFAEALAEPVDLDRVALFEEPERGRPFTCIRLERLTGAAPDNQ
uniref:DUF1045 domain-containing protein n=1 Tax=Stappia sp. TaxID=1870903 RepID=UPI003BAC74D3